MVVGPGKQLQGKWYAYRSIILLFIITRIIITALKYIHIDLHTRLYSLVLLKTAQDYIKLKSRDY